MSSWWSSSYWFLISCGLILLGALGYLEKILKLNLSVKTLVILLIIFALFSGLSLYRQHLLSNHIAQVQTKLSDLEQKTAPRSLSPEQVKTLLDALKSPEEVGKAPNYMVIKNVVVTAANGNQEAQSYAMQFVKMFKAAGCESDLNLSIPGLRPDVIGVHIGIRGSQNIPEGAPALARILANAGIQSTISQMEPDFANSFPEAPFVLVVGAKS